jgi:hypothetical protein
VYKYVFGPLVLADARSHRLSVRVSMGCVQIVRLRNTPGKPRTSNALGKNQDLNSKYWQPLFATTANGLLSGGGRNLVSTWVSPVYKAFACGRAPGPRDKCV